MLVSLAMSNTQYLGSRGHSEHLHDGLPERSCDSPAPTVAYTGQELDPFNVSGVSSFNYPAPTDPTLLTPVSSGGSPPLHQRTSVKGQRAYHSSQTAVSGAQGPTPPNTSRMYYSTYDLSSQSPSPITVHTQVTEAGSFEMNPFATHSPPAAHQPSPRESNDLPPPPIDTYLPYNVCTGNDDVPSQFYGGQHYSGVDTGTANPNMIKLARSQEPPSVAMTGSHLPGIPAPSSILGHPSQPGPYRPQLIIPGKPPSLVTNGILINAHPPFPNPHSLVPGPRSRPSRQKKSRQPRSSKKTAASLNEGARATKTTDGPASKKEFITLGDGCTAEDRKLFELRLKYHHIKGKGMWDKIGEDFFEYSQGKGREALQMRVHRMVAKYGIWPDAEERRLGEAFAWCEEQFTKQVLSRLKETGGGECWEWRPEHIEAKLVKMGLMEPAVDEKVGHRKRRKSAFRRGGRHSMHHPYQQSFPNGIGEWGTMGLQSAFRGPMASSYDMLHSDNGLSAQSPILTATAERDEVVVTDEMIDQMFPMKTHFKEEPVDSVSPEAMELAYSNGHDDGSNDHDDSNRAGNSPPGTHALRATHSPPSNGRREHSSRVAHQEVNRLLGGDQYRGRRA